MKVVSKITIIIVTIIVLLLLISMTCGKVQEKETLTITEWQTKWGLDTDLITDIASLEQQEGWINSNISTSLLPKTKGNQSVWYRIRLPKMDWNAPSLFINKVYGQHIIVRTANTLIYESRSMYNYKVNKMIIPIQTMGPSEVLYIGVETDKGRIGIQSELILGDFPELLSSFINQDLVDVILGSSFIFVSLIILICSVFLRREFLSVWISLAIVILSTGILVITYSSYSHTIFGQNESLFVITFDVALFVLLPTLTFFFEKILGNGYYSIIRYFRVLQMGYSSICIILMILNKVSIDKYYDSYHFLSVEILGYMIIMQCLLLVITSVVYVGKGNKDAILLSIGFMFIAGTALFEMLQFYSRSGNYNFSAWKWGVVSFIVVLIIISGRRFASTHDQVVQYSKKLELFNNELQRSEKIEIISELAASVAHEVRNPLQVTRGFLQLLMERFEKQKDQDYLTMALDELDHASNIITDFLTFAKPGFDRTTVLNIRDELQHIEGILLPLVNLSGGEISVEVPLDLRIRGNSSKFKQALINLIKNSIEAWQEEGNIRIWAYQEGSVISVHIQDNGEGMCQEELTRLGEPYFSNKTKGTGLGLMVSFRIIEVMQGEIHYTSEKGIGTEAIITFPSIME